MEESPMTTPKGKMPEEPPIQYGNEFDERDSVVTRWHYDALRAYCAGLEADAERFRKLLLESPCAFPFRDNLDSTVGYCIAHRQCGCVYNVELDAAIDAERGKEKP